METCECPMCDAEINLWGYEENEVIQCAACGIELEIVSLTPPVVEEPLEEDDDWDDWDDKEDDDWDDKEDDDWDDQGEVESQNYDGGIGMAKKKHHMTKHEYEGYNTRRRYAHDADFEGEENGDAKTIYGKYWERSDAEMKKHLRSIQYDPDDIFDEEYEEYLDI